MHVTQRWVAWSRRFLAVALAVAGGIALAQPLKLDAAAGVIDAWPAVTVLSDPSHTMTLEQVVARRNEFAAPTGPHANLGQRKDAVWLRLAVQVPAGQRSAWILALEYASLDNIQLHVLGGDGTQANVALGRMLPNSQHPLPSASHATPLTLQPGQTYELFLRVDTRSSMVLPLLLATPEAFHGREAQAQMLQGLLAGAALALLLYSLTQWLSLRDVMFLQYALALGCTALFFVAYYGLGPQHLWGENVWMVQNVAPFFVLMALAGACLFVDRALAVAELRPWISRALRAEALVAGLTALAFGLDLVSYRGASLVATILGPMPMLLAIPVAYRRARQGERVGLYMLVGWGFYFAATLTMAALLRGWAPSNFWTQHAFQFGSMIEMAMWMRVLAVRIEDMRTAAQRATLERDTLRTLAHTDALTGLPNRRGLTEVLDRVLPVSVPERMTAVYLVDLDGFKPVNDRFGHDVGDALLVAVARRLEGLVRNSDTVARLGGDEFVIVATRLPGDAEAQALGRKLLAGFQQPFQVAGQECRVGLTVGYALAPLDGSDALSLLKRADAAMYAGKQAGRNCLQRGGASAGLVAA